MELNTDTNGKTFSRLFLAAVLATAFVAYPVVAAHHGGVHDAEDALHEQSGAEGSAHKRHKFAKKRAELLKKELDLSEEQAAEMQNQRQLSKQALKPLYESLRSNKQALRAAQNAEQYDVSEIERLAAEGADINRQITIQRSAQKRALRDILSPEQREKMQELRSSRKGKGKKRMYKHRDRSGHADSEADPA